jgi:arylsulfatase A-like enzyme
MYDPNAIPVPKLPADAAAQRAACGDRRHCVDDERMMRVMSAIYYGSITHIDTQLARLFGELNKLGMADNTLILFTADHGNMLGDRGRWFKGVQYDGSARVPLLWKGPKGAKENGGRVVENVVDNADLAPSILEAAGLPVPEGMQGRSFLKLARGEAAGWRDRSYSQLRSGMLLDGDYKYIDNSLDGTGPKELYDMRNDPKEQRDLSSDPKQKDRLAQYARDMAAWRADRPAPVKIAGMATPRYAQLTEAERREAARQERPAGRPRNPRGAGEGAKGAKRRP